MNGLNLLLLIKNKTLIYLSAILYNIWKVYLGIIFVSSLLFFYPILLLFIKVKSLKKHTFRINILWSRVFRILSLYAVHINDFNSKKVDYPCIICANHTSYLDIFLMYSVLKEHRFLFMGKSEILKYPLVKTFFKGLNIPVYRDDRLKAAKSFIQAKKSLHEGWSIVIFPEGVIPEETPFLIPFKDGAFKLAKTAKVGVLPVTFENNYRLFSDPENVLHSAFPGLVKITIHELINTDTVQEKTIAEINNTVFHSINHPLPKKVNANEDALNRYSS